jgi:hypothetical protein
MQNNFSMFLSIKMATQCLNNLFFGEISEDSESGGSPPSGASESAARERELRAKFRLSILDNDVYYTSSVS